MTEHKYVEMRNASPQRVQSYLSDMAGQGWRLQHVTTTRVRDTASTANWTDDTTHYFFWAKEY